VKEVKVQGYMTVSEVGRIAIGSSRSDWPLHTLTVKISDSVLYLMRSKSEQDLMERDVDIRSGDPSNLGSEALDVVLLLLKTRVGDEHGEVGVLDTKLLDLLVKPG
jgi:hypothetical protein